MQCIIKGLNLTQGCIHQRADDNQNIGNVQGRTTRLPWLFNVLEGVEKSS